VDSACIGGPDHYGPKVVKSLEKDPGSYRVGYHVRENDGKDHEEYDVQYLVVEYAHFPPATLEPGPPVDLF
jgi:hypothetical protein